MDEEEKKTAEEQTEETKPEEQPAEPQEPEETPAEEEAQEETPAEAEEDTPTEPEPEAPVEEPTPPEQSTEQQLREENFRLKTQLEAMKLGFLPDVIEDAVVLAENVARREGVEITEALAAVAKKYPAWKSGGTKGGIRIGADRSAAKKENKQAPAAKRWNRTNH